MSKVSECELFLDHEVGVHLCDVPIAIAQCELFPFRTPAHYMHMHIYIYILLHVHLHVHLCTFELTFASTCAHLHVQVRTHLHYIVVQSLTRLDQTTLDSNAKYMYALKTHTVRSR